MIRVLDARSLPVRCADLEDQPVDATAARIAYYALPSVFGIIL